MAPATIRTMADWMRRVGDVPLDRVCFHPAPGTATIEDVERMRTQEGRRYELVEGVLLEKTVGLRESMLAVYLAAVLDAFVRPGNLGIVLGADGTMAIVANLVRIPDVAFIRWDRLPGRRLPEEPVPLVTPNLAVEILSKINTPGEMAVKRREYFEAGVEVVWEVEPRQRIVAVYTTPTAPIVLSELDTLEGGSVLPGFRLAVKDLFGELDRKG